MEPFVFAGDGKVATWSPADPPTLRSWIDPGDESTVIRDESGLVVAVRDKALDEWIAVNFASVAEWPPDDDAWCAAVSGHDADVDY